ncbi:hypothetical protein M3Y97_00461400 [Aphelenchoides bicaudatus]|nr:hypothetical protein M3Y97_00461400 [Aphelenchoides bicaudatus]
MSIKATVYSTIFVLIFLNVMAMPNILGVSDHSAQQTFLEDFQLDAQNVKIHDANAEQLELAFTVPNDTNGLSVLEFYSKAVDQLKEKYGKIKKMRLRGGYIFKPTDPKSGDELKQELDYLAQTLKAIDKAVNEKGIRLRRLILTAALNFDGTNGVNVSELLRKEFPEEELREHGDTNWGVPFKIQHGRGVIKLDVQNDKHFAQKPQGRTRYFPVNSFASRMGPGPMTGSASYDPEKNVTRIWSHKSGQIELQGNHMDSEELDEYFPRNMNDE